MLRLFFALFLCMAITQGYEYKYNLGFDFYLDNTEESLPYWDTRTIYGVRLAPEIGIAFDGRQSLMFGGYVLQNMGEQRFPTKANVSIYYSAIGEHLRSYFGIFPRTHSIAHYPLSFFRNDFYFFNPNINGLMFQYQQQDPTDKYTGYAELIFDWYGGNLAKRLDEFMVLAASQWDFWQKYLYVGGNFLMYHFKNDEVLAQDGHQGDTYLLDRIYYNLYIGSSLQNLLPSMEKAPYIQFGTLSTLERKRRLSTGLDPFYNGLGWQLDIGAQYKGFGIKNSYYFGKPQMKYFSQYGEGFYSGLPFYQSKHYDRADFYYEYKNDILTARFSIIFHFTNKTIANQEMLTISLDTHQIIKKLKSQIQN
ncbi:hypothetical protein BKH46_05225 [Helicobacter sp. 12S02634-8]|uniref:hypothetical protein n=1 Tax=Helicobacter sp. 12S02634-8 TaxID=1476199 RepID=UPI000BA68763|nr:hypothetical protein [Helicobacter sp. 12S02634-8]PAF47113.1 hypothetical protein BKH46_05225 [Helicobacter sp. 12S02634-8]